LRGSVALLCLSALLFLGCAAQHPPVDSVKSCQALQYESDSVAFLLQTLKEEAQEARAKPMALHLFVVAAGAAISLQPALLTGESFYLAPAVTIAYYNLVAAPPEALARYEILQTRQQKLAQLIEENDCNRTNQHSNF
jgi:hypothetical protein